MSVETLLIKHNVKLQRDGLKRWLINDDYFLLTLLLISYA